MSACRKSVSESIIGHLSFEIFDLSFPGNWSLSCDLSLMFPALGNDKSKISNNKWPMRLLSDNDRYCHTSFARLAQL